LTGALTGARDLRANDAFIEWNGTGVAQPGGYVHDTPDGLVRDRNLGSPEINAANATPWRSVVTGDRWKLNLSAHDRCELFDLSADPHELTNLYDDPQHADQVGALSARIRQWQQRTGDETTLPEAAS
jgi:arylsulfatase A-like enzyme